VPLLNNIVAQVRTWFNRSPVGLSTPSASTQIAPAPERKPLDQRYPTLWAAKSSDARKKMWCGPVAVAATIGVDVAAVSDVIKRHRNGKSVKGTHPNELQLAFRHFGYDMTLVADLRSKPPTLATWERERTDMEATYVVVVTGHWVAARGKWFCDTFTHGVPVKIKDAPGRRKRVQFVYRITVVPR
jgi:hypothetical protein